MAVTPGDPAVARSGPVQSVDRAVSILELLAELGEAGVTELAAALDVHKSTASRLVAALEAHGLVEQVAERGRYRLGLAVVRLAGAVTTQLDVTRRSRPAAEGLARRSGETVNIAVADSGAVVNVDQVRGSASVITHNWVGERTPLHATSSGKVLMAFRPEVGAAVLAGPLPGFTGRTQVDGARLAEELAVVRDRGWAITSEELEIGLTAVAAPVRGPRGDVVAALSVSGPAYRLDGARVDELVPEVVAAAAEASAALGWRSRTV
ncbi:IclR family transcriptional regulator [Kineococcus gynurae]|uniref:IclR family transcriptional regulator n=1 Tax=Kineococcus gynurae TaxID=452979 RepID=A0ABV5LS23_9ACTN